MIKKDTDKLLDIICSHQERLYRTAFIYMKNSDDAAEAVQEAVYRAFMSIGSLRKPEYVLTWVTRILINVCNTELKRRSRDMAGVVNEPEISSEAEDLDNVLTLRQYVDNLDHKYREVIMLKYYGGYTTKEIANFWDIPEGTVKIRLKRAVEQLGSLMKKGGYDE